MKELLRSLNLGNSVAEFDDSLEKYFVENEAFHKLVNDNVDVIAGDKGTGKTALYKILQKRYRTLPQLKDVEILTGFNPAGNPIFQRLVSEAVLSEGQYASVWKAYLLSLVGNWVLDIVGDEQSNQIKRLSRLLSDAGLRSADDKPETIFSKIVNSIQQWLHPQSASVQLTFSETGIPIISPKVTFGSGNEASEVREVSHEHALRLLDECLAELGYVAWIFLDRLDEAFQGFPDVEVPALRALLRTYLDLLEFKNFRLKLFVRRDLFRRIIGGGFVNLTHINARKFEIVWDEKDLLNLLCRRVRDNADLMRTLGAGELSDDDLFYRVFPGKVDLAERKPTTWNWMLARIRDGNNVKPPRNLIGLATMARDEQLKAEARTPRTFGAGEPLITAESIRKALERLSAQRVEDTLLAEAGAKLSPLIQRFRGKKAEQNRESLASTLGPEGEELSNAIRQLVEMGFLEESKASWKVPMLYRAGLEITQGKAFADSVGTGEDDDSE